MKKTKRARIGKIGEIILATVAVAGVVSIAVVAPNALKLLEPFLKNKKYSKNTAVNRNIDSLVRSGHLTKSVNRKGEITLSLSKKGRWENLLRGGPTVPNKWDGKWRVVIFDIPNEKQKMRDELRRGIRMYGFYQLQQSVWVYPYQCIEFVSLIKEYLGVGNDVLVMEATSLENDKELRRHFEL